MQYRRDRVDAYLEFRAALRDVLASGDVKQFRAFLRDVGAEQTDPELAAMGRWNDEALLPVMHRMVVADPKLKPHHAPSRAWLRERHIPMRVRSVGYGWSTELRQRYIVADRPTRRSA